MSWRRACLTIVVLLIIIIPMVTQTQAFVDRQLELVSGNLLFQDQFYFTAPTQRLFHSQTAAGTDSEAFSFSPVSGGGFALAQTSSASTIATDTGFFFAFSSFKKFNCPTGEGYMHTSINDPLVSRTPVFSSLIFPSMITKDQITRIAGSASVSAPVTAGSAGQETPIMSSPAKQAATDMPAINEAGNNSLNNMTIIEPLIKKQISSGQVGVPDTSNIMSATPTPTPLPTLLPTGKPAPAFGVTSTSGRGQELPGPTLMPTPAPSPRPSYAVLPDANSLLTKPLSHQANKPFTSALDPDYNPRTACRDDIRNISGWNRLTTNVIGRSAIDSIYLSRTSSPSYINPSNAIKLANQFNVLSETRNMTHAGTYLQQRMWAL
jgi:hypothetical protein